MTGAGVLNRTRRWLNRRISLRRVDCPLSYTDALPTPDRDAVCSVVRTRERFPLCSRISQTIARISCDGCVVDKTVDRTVD